MSNSNNKGSKPPNKLRDILLEESIRHSDYSERAEKRIAPTQMASAPMPDVKPPKPNK